MTGPIDGEDHEESLAHFVAVGKGQFIPRGNHIMHAYRFPFPLHTENRNLQSFRVFDAFAA